MNITQVRYVLAVAKYQSFSKAASHLYITQPALSLQIRKLEEELETPLFTRTPQGVFLTDAGHAFCKDAKPVIVAWERLQRNMASRKRQAGTLRIGLGARVYSNNLFEEIADFFNTHTELEVTFVTDSVNNILDELAENRLDLVLDRMPPENLINNRSIFYTKDLIRERHCVLLSPNDPRSHFTELAYTSMNGESVITGPENSMDDRIMQRDAAYYGVTTNRTYRCNSVATSMSLVRTGKGYALGPASYGQHYHVSAVPMIPEVYISLSFICLKQRAQDPAFVLFRDFLTKLCRDHKM